MTKQNSHNQSIERVRSFSRAPQLSSRSVSASAAETAAGRLGRRTGMPAALAAVKPASAAASGRQRSHSCWCGARGGSRCAGKMMILEKYDDFVMILMMCHDVS